MKRQFVVLVAACSGLLAGDERTAISGPVSGILFDAQSHVPSRDVATSLVRWAPPTVHAEQRTTDSAFGHPQSTEMCLGLAYAAFYSTSNIQELMRRTQ